LFSFQSKNKRDKGLERELNNERKKRRERKESLLLRGLLPFSSTSIINCSGTYSSINNKFSLLDHSMADVASILVALLQKTNHLLLLLQSAT
jgi:hypothetical protein